MICMNKFKSNQIEKKCARTGNRTRASRVAGENSTTEPSMLRQNTASETFKTFHSFTWAIASLPQSPLSLLRPNS